MDSVEELVAIYIAGKIDEEETCDQPNAVN